jgi:hypothetical protein
LPWLAWHLDPPDFCLASSWDYRPEARYLLKIHLKGQVGITGPFQVLKSGVKKYKQARR